MQTHQEIPHQIPGRPEHTRVVNAVLSAVRCNVVRPARPDPIGTELAQLEAMGLHETAARLRSASPPAEPPTLPDGVWLDYEAHPVYGCGRSLQTICVVGADLDEYLVRHARGDHGAHGTGPVGEANARAIAAGEGLVRSRFETYRKGIDDPPKNASGQSVSQRRRNPGEWIEVLTAIAPGRPPFTLVATCVCGVSAELSPPIQRQRPPEDMYSHPVEQPTGPAGSIPGPTRPKRWPSLA